ncbi:amino acid adenylation domain-containing protein [Kitasatospora sp. NPDC004240]
MRDASSTTTARTTRPTGPGPFSLPALLAQQARARGGAVAVTGDGRALTFRQLDRASGRLAGYLRSLGVGPDTCVGLYLEPSLDLMTGVWGVLAAGAGYLPLSPEYPEERLRHMIDDSRTRVVLTQPHLAGRLAGLVPPGTRIVTAADAGGHTGPRPEPPGADDLAYVIYTSGSTGRPKGVMIEHRAVVSQMRWLHAHGHLGADSTVLQKTPMSFDAAQWELLAPAVGARVAMGTPGLHRDPHALIAAVREHGVTTLQCVPTLLQALLDTEELAGCATLRQVFSGGEALSQRLAAALGRALPRAALVNLYGPTECTINATAHLVDPERLGDGGSSVPIGVPVDNTQCFILDENLAPVDIGTTGELYIGGVQLARGYLNHPEQTRRRFVPSPFVPTQRLYRTGDLAHWNPDGTIQFAGRTDNQIKLRGHRIELDEIRLAIEEHTWVKRAAALVTDDERTGSQHLIACVELNPKEAALMDQGNHGRHHQSKSGRLQVRAQLSDPGVREEAELAGRPVTALPGREGTARQRREVFARKTYRFFEGGTVTREDLLGLLAPYEPPQGPPDEPPQGPPDGPALRTGGPTFAELGEVLRWFGQFRSAERLLPKYAYASPGALYATQLYLESDGGGALATGVYYYHPLDHTLVRVGDATGASGAGPSPVGPGGLTVHLLGKRRAIEPVYRTNILEVLELEAGHMLGVFEEVLAPYGLGIRPLHHRPGAKAALDVAEEDHYLGAFTLGPRDATPRPPGYELYLQVHPDRVEGLAPGQYRYADGRLEHLSEELVHARHVIAINQQVYRRASFGVTAVARPGGPAWLEYIGLGTALHRLQRNGLRLGLMSSGYSSRSGHPLPAARRIDDILTARGLPTGPSYFFLGGKVGEEQIDSEGMYEDTVHMKGPAEIVRDELANLLPPYMVPNRVLVLDELPLTANGKVDLRALAADEQVRGAERHAPYTAPATPTERHLAEVWGRALKYERVSSQDDFFAAGGNSLTAVTLINTLNRHHGIRLPLQVLFRSPRLADLAARIDRDLRGGGGGEDAGAAVSRLVPLQAEGGGHPVFCWPGLGGYPMNLRLLARAAGTERPFYGIQAHGINAGETPYPTIREMAAADIAEILRVQPEGPYTLWGYSFGARLAFETAWQLERAGRRVERLLLICPGNPSLPDRPGRPSTRESSYDNPAYVTILYSVFTGTVDGPDLERCLETVRDEGGFTAHVHRLLPELDEGLIRRIVRIVGRTYEFDYSFHELTERRLDAPVTILKATGDDYSFIEKAAGFSAAPPTVRQLRHGHYAVLREAGVGELAEAAG